MKKQTSALHDTIILVIITLVAGVILGVVHDVTAGPIAEQEAATHAAAQKEVFEDADSFTSIEGFDTDEFEQMLLDQGLDQTTVYEIDEADDADGNKLGYVVDVGNNEGYGGEVELMVGITVDGSDYMINGISFLNLEETAGMGMKAEDPEFKDQFNNMDIGDAGQIVYTKSGKSAANEIDAISGCTITTNAVTKAVNGALAAVAYEEG
ncbi:MAG: RnfABCDGE type electron transport complex subunit G [Bilifractor sp.]|jgi:electron transport complex protein RnfG